MSKYRPKLPQRPLVVCVGFLGSKPRHVQKYADLLGSIDVNIAPLEHPNQKLLTKPDVIQFIPPLDTFISSKNIRNSAKTLGDMIEKEISTPAPLLSQIPKSVNNLEPKLEQQIETKLETPGKSRNFLFPWQTIPLETPRSIVNDINNYQPRKVMFLCLSNNGAFGFANMLNYLKREKPKTFKQLNSQTAGVIWDSSPSHPTPDVFERGFVSAVGTLIGRKPQAKDPLLTPLFSGVINYLLQSPAYNQAAKDVTHVLDYCVPYHAPQLYLITEQDDLVLSEDTRKFVKHRSQRVKEFFQRYPTHGHYSSALGIHYDGSKLPENNNGFQLYDKTHTLNIPNDGIEQVMSIKLSPDQISLNIKNGERLVGNRDQNISKIDTGFDSKTDSNIFDWEKITDNINTINPKGELHYADDGHDHYHIHQDQIEHFYHYNYHQHIYPHYSCSDSDYHHKTYLSKDTGNDDSDNMTRYTDPVDYHKLPSLLPHLQYPKDSHHGHNNNNNHHCPHTQHLDVLFTPKHKNNLITLKNDPKIKPLFEKTEQFEDCSHHFLYDFKDSAHVQHIRKHPQEYKELVEAFCNFAFRG
jgi:hypothetical protein